MRVTAITRMKFLFGQTYCVVVLLLLSINVFAQNKVNYQEALAIILAKECGYVNHKSVRGGETYCGITRKTHPDWEGWTTIEKRRPKRDEILPELNQQVATFYRINYWDKIRGDEIHNQQTANQFFDAAVRQGRERAIMSQEAKYGLKKTGVVSDALINAINSRH
jgi:lysozyme family protein